MINQLNINSFQFLMIHTFGENYDLMYVFFNSFLSLKIRKGLYQFIYIMLSNKLLNISCAKKYFRNISCFSRRKGLQENLKSKQSKKTLEELNSQQNISQDLVEVSKMKILNSQFFPMSFLLIPTLWSLDEMYDPTFLLGQLLVQKCATFALLMNLDFQQSKRKTVVIMSLIASLHALSGYYSIVTPFGMSLLTILSPFKLTQIESIRMKTMTNIRMIYFFIFVLLTTVKAMHYEAKYSIQTKLDKFNEQNLQVKANQQSL